MQEKINNHLITIARLLIPVCAAVLLSCTKGSISVFAQGMGGGMMGMGGGSRGMRNQNSQQQNDNPAPPKHQNPFAIDAPAVEGLEARTAALENFIFGSVQKKLPMKVRVEKLEKKLVPYEHHKADESLEERVDHLWTMLSSANRSSDKAPTQ